jgi:hypothetical protein
MRFLPNQRPSALPVACTPVTALGAHASVVGLAAVTVQRFQGWTTSGFMTIGAGTIAASKVDNYIGTSAKGAGLGTSAADQKVRVNEARGIPPRGRPV